uniref:Uncharacterized protein n=1 Tax=Gasterosteus aculeatus TaxID=69293 RepID=G3PGS7_GASAC
MCIIFYTYIHNISRDTAQASAYQSSHLPLTLYWHSFKLHLQRRQKFDTSVINNSSPILSSQHAAGRACIEFPVQPETLSQHLPQRNHNLSQNLPRSRKRLVVLSEIHNDGRLLITKKVKYFSGGRKSQTYSRLVAVDLAGAYLTGYSGLSLRGQELQSRAPPSSRTPAVPQPM